jgi:YVTN family beta-propeller protein
MIQVRLYSIFLLLLFIGGCFPQEYTYNYDKGPLDNEGEVLVYLQTLPQEASKLRFVMDGIFAVRDDGRKIPLFLSVNDINGSELLGRQKLLATGILPPGAYTGLSIKTAKAFVQSEEGEVALLVPEEPVIAPKLFQVNRRQAITLFLSLHASGIISRGISFTPDFSLATSGGVLVNLTGYVSNSAANLIFVFNKKTMKVVNVIAIGRGPKGVVLDQRRTRAYVAVSGDDAVEIYDLFSGTVVGRVKLNFGDNPMDLALTPDGRTLVSVNHSSNTVSIIDAISKIELRRIRVGEKPTSAVIDPQGLRAYITNSRSNTVSVVDLSQRTFTATISVEGSPVRGAFNRAGDRLYVVSSNSPNLSVIDATSLRVTDKIFIGTGGVSIRVSRLNGLIFVGKSFGGEIAVVDPSSSMFIDSIGVGGNAAHMTIDRQENVLFVVLPERRLVQKINLTSKKIMAEIEVAGGAYAVVVMGE